MPITVDIPGLGEVEFPDSMSMEEVTRQSQRLFAQHSKAPTNAPPQAALEPNAIQRVIRSAPVQSILGPLKAGMEGVEKAAAFLGNEAIATYKMATGQPLVEQRAVQRPIIGPDGRPTGQTEFVNEWVDTYKYFKPGQSILPFGPANERTVAKIGRDVEGPMQAFNSAVAGFASGLTTPGNLATLPLVLGKVPKVAGPMTTRQVGERVADIGLRTAIAAPMLEQSFEGGARAMDNRLPVEERIQGGIEAVLSGLLGTKISADMFSRATVAPGAEGSQLVPTRQFIDGEWQTVFQPANLIGESGLLPGDIPSGKGMLYGRAPTDQGQIAKDLGFLGIDPNQRVGRLEPADFMRSELESMGYGVKQLKPQDLVPPVPRQVPLLTPEQAEAGLGRTVTPMGESPVDTLLKEPRVAKATEPMQSVPPPLPSPETPAVAEAPKPTVPPIPKTGESGRLYMNPVVPLAKDLVAGGKVLGEAAFDVARATGRELEAVKADLKKWIDENSVTISDPVQLAKFYLESEKQKSVVVPPFASRWNKETLWSIPDWVEPGSILDKSLMSTRENPAKGIDITPLWKTMTPLQRRELLARGWVVRDTRKPGQVVLGVNNDAISAKKYFSQQLLKQLKESEGNQNKTSKVADDTGRLYMNPVGPLLKPIYEMGKEGAKIGAEKAKAVASGGVDLVNYYSRPLVQRLEGKGGPVAKQLSTQALNIVDDSKNIYGDMATRHFDKAKKATGRLNAANTWFRGTESITPETRVSHWYRGMEEQGANVPTHAQNAFRTTQDANFYAGQLRQSVAPGFIPGGKPQRMLTPEGMDLVLNDATGRDSWVRGIAAASKVDEAKVRAHVQEWAAELAKQVPDVTTLERIAQDFRQQYPRVPTQVKTKQGWVTVIQDDPFRYLESLQRETAEVVSFRRVFPRDSGRLQETIDSVTRELTDRGQGADVEGLHQLLRALQGQPVDNTRTSQGMLTQRLISKASPAINVLKSANLTASVFPNLAELAYGGPEMFLGTKTGWRSGIKLLLDMPQQDINRQMEMMGARDKFMRNWAWDPRRPVESGARYFSNTLNKFSGTSLINEIQEGKAAFAARIVADDIASGNLSASRAKDLRTLLRMMGWTEAEATSTIKGDKALLDRFVRKSSSWLTGGNVARAEMSRAGASRLFNTVFWFHRYPQMVANRLRANMVLLIDDTKALLNAPQGRQTEHWSRVARDVKMLAKQAVGLGVQGAVANGILATLGAGSYYGTQQLRERFQNHPLETIMEFYRTALGGPVAMTARLMENAGDFDRVVREVLGTSALFGNLAEFYNFSMGAGRYRTLSPGDRVMKFLSSRTPGHKAFLTGMAITGLADWDPELEAAMRGLAKWRRDKGFTAITDPGKDSTVEFRAQMRKVTKELEKGGDWIGELGKIPDTSLAARSLRAKTFLVGDGDKPLTPAEEKDLASYIGQKAVKKLRMRDAALREVARELTERDRKTGERPKPTDLPQPTPGSKAIDIEAASARGERTLGMLKPETQAILKRNEIAGFNYEPKARRGRLLTPDEGRNMETNYVREFEKLMTGFEKRYGDKSMAVQRKVISRYMEAARARSAPRK